MDGIKPYLNFNGNCEEAINYYKEALGGEVLFIQRYGEAPPMEGCEGMENKVMHTTLKIGDSVVMASDCPPGQPAAAGSNISLAMGTDNPARADEMFNKLADGGNITMPIQETFWAQRFGMLTDKFGINWMFNCDKPHETDKSATA